MDWNIVSMNDVQQQGKVRVEIKKEQRQKMDIYLRRVIYYFYSFNQRTFQIQQYHIIIHKLLCNYYQYSFFPFTSTHINKHYNTFHSSHILTLSQNITLKLIYKNQYLYNPIFFLFSNPFSLFPALSNLNQYKLILKINGINIIIILKVLFSKEFKSYTNMLKSSSKLKKTPNHQDKSNKSKTFIQKNCQIDYSNHFQVSQRQKQQTPKQISIENIVYQKTGNNFRKKTEIYIGNSLVIIQQNFDIDKLNNKTESTIINTQIVNPITSESSNQNDDSYKEEEIIKEQYRQHRRDKKNVVKNIIKAFLNWLKQLTSNQNPSLMLISAKDNLEKMIQQIKFNNKLIWNVTNNQSLNFFFEDYLKNYAKDWIYSSRINDKQSHIQSIQEYIKFCNNNKKKGQKLNKKER